MVNSVVVSAIKSHRSTKVFSYADMPKEAPCCFFFKSSYAILGVKVTEVSQEASGAVLLSGKEPVLAQHFRLLLLQVMSGLKGLRVLHVCI